MAIPERIEAFLDEYEALCRKHGLMVLSEGEALQVDEADETLWHIRESVRADLASRQKD